MQKGRRSSGGVSSGGMHWITREWTALAYLLSHPPFLYFMHSLLAAPPVPLSLGLIRSLPGDHDRGPVRLKPLRVLLTAFAPFLGFRPYQRSFGRVDDNYAPHLSLFAKLT